MCPFMLPGADAAIAPFPVGGGRARELLGAAAGEDAHSAAGDLQVERVAANGQAMGQRVAHCKKHSVLRCR